MIVIRMSPSTAPRKLGTTFYCGRACRPPRGLRPRALVDVALLRLHRALRARSRFGLGMHALATKLAPNFRGAVLSLPAFFLAAALLLVSGPAFPWVRAVCKTLDGEPLYCTQPGNCVSWSLNAEGTVDIDDFGALYNAVRASFETWNAVECTYLKFKEDGITSCGCGNRGYNGGGGNQNVVTWCEDSWPYEAEHPSAVAITAVSYDELTGEILDADVLFNGPGFDFAVVEDVDTCENETDVQNTMTHEAGHMLGLGEGDVRDGTMWPYTQDCELKKRTLHDDDIEGVCTLYPVEDDPGTCDSPLGGLDDCVDKGCECGCRVISNRDSPQALFIGVILMLAFLALVIMRKIFRVTR